MARGRMIRNALSAMLVVSTLTVGMVAMTPTVAGASKPTSATWAEAPSATPNYILPFYPGSLCSTANITQFQWLMYRPLYFYGTGSSYALDEANSLADPPSFSNSNKTVTINMKDWKWSNGESVTAQDVIFFMNIYKAEPKNFCGYVPGYMPDNVTDVVADSPTQLTFTFNRTYNSYWLTYNEFSQITPFPQAWDITSAGAAPGSGGCFNAAYGSSTAQTKCAAVYTFLSNEAGYNATNPSAALSPNTYPTNPMWQVVDGPWHLTHFDDNGNVTMAPNSKYSGPVKATLKTFTEVPFTSGSAEFNALLGGNLNVGYVPQEDITTPASTMGASSGPNNPRVTNYKLAPLYTWSITYFPENFFSTANNGTAGKIFSQAYFRQAFQSMINQPQYIKKLFKNYAVPSYGPVPVKPQNSLASSLEKKNPFPYNPSKAKSLLSSHGWKIVPNGTDTCQKPGTGSGQCGAGIPKGTPLNITMDVSTGVAAVTTMMQDEKSSWSTVGINVTLVQQTFNQVTGQATPCPQGCSWQMLQWGAGWTFLPDAYPTGEELFGNGSEANYGAYGPTVAGFNKNEQLITATINTSQSLTTWENYLATQLPVVFEPTAATELTEIQNNLHGVTPQNVYWALTPETWRYS